MDPPYRFENQMFCDVDCIDDDEYANLDRILRAVEENICPPASTAAKNADNHIAKRPCCVASAMQTAPEAVNHPENAAIDLSGSHVKDLSTGEDLASFPFSGASGNAKASMVSTYVSKNICRCHPVLPAGAGSSSAANPMQLAAATAQQEARQTPPRRKLPQSFSQRQVVAPTATAGPGRPAVNGGSTQGGHLITCLTTCHPSAYLEGEGWQLSSGPLGLVHNQEGLDTGDPGIRLGMKTTAVLDPEGGAARGAVLGPPPVASTSHQTLAFKGCIRCGMYQVCGISIVGIILGGCFNVSPAPHT